MYKVIIRTIFYHWLILCVGISIGFIGNAEWIGYKSLLVSKSINNIFFPIDITPEIQQNIKNIGQQKLRISIGNPEHFVILDDFLYDNEIYWAEYEFVDKYGKKIKQINKVRIYWKPWEYYYHLDDSLRASKH
jgi:hypothetical protein